MSSSLITDLPKGIVPSGRRNGASRLIGEIVVDLGLASREDVEAAVQQARTEGRSTGDMLVARGTLTSDELARVLAERFSVDYVDLGVFSVDMNAAHLIASDAARRYEAVPIGYLDERTLLLATADPGNIVAFDDITMKTGLDVRPVVASREDLAVLIAKLTRLDDVAEAAAEAEEEVTRGRPARRRRRGADHQARPRDHRRGDRPGLQRHPLRPRGRGDADLLPHRRRALARRAPSRRP